MSKRSNTKNFNIILLILCIIPFGFDKLYCHNTPCFLAKFLLHFIGLGLIWWLFDIICVCVGKYKVNPFK